MIEEMTPREDAMAKGEQRSNKEKKKPKQDKPKGGEVKSPFASSGKGGPAGQSKAKD